jgi:CheY-like chemotaxis protein
LRQEATRIARHSDGSKAESDSARKSGGGVRTKVLYFNPESVDSKYVDIIRQRGHDLATASIGADALAMMRRQLFDALVMDCAQDTLDIQTFTAKAQGLQPSLAVFLADEWGDELVTGLEEFGHVLTMLEDDECARLAVESRMG